MLLPFATYYTGLASPHMSLVLTFTAYTAYSNAFYIGVCYQVNNSLAWLVIQVHNSASDLHPFLTTTYCKHVFTLDSEISFYFFVFQKSKQLKIEPLLLCLVYIVEISELKSLHTFC